MTLMQVYDPPMCCSSGVCGPNVNAGLAQFSSDLEWLESQGVEVRRYNLAHEPGAFVDQALVKGALAKSGEKCLPLILVDGEIVAEGTYPSREELAVLVSIATDSLYSRKVEALVAIGAAIAANCETCFAHHFHEARKAGVSRDDITLAVATARKIKEAAAVEIAKVVGRHLASAAAEETLKVIPCCTPAAGTSAGKCC